MGTFFDYMLPNKIIDNRRLIGNFITNINIEYFITHCIYSLVTTYLFILITMTEKECQKQKSNLV